MRSSPSHHPRPAASSVDRVSGLARVRRLQLLQIGILIAMAILVCALGLLAARSLLDASARQRSANDFLRDLVTLRDQGRLAQITYWRTTARGQEGITPLLGVQLVSLTAGTTDLAARQAERLPAGPEAEGAAARVVSGFAGVTRAADVFFATADPAERRRQLERTLGTVDRLGVDFDAWVQARVDAANLASQDLDRTIRRLAVEGFVAVIALTVLGVFLWFALGRTRNRVLAHIEAARREQAALRHVAELVAREDDAEAVFAALAREVVLLTGAEAGWMVRIEDGGDAVAVAAAGGGPESVMGRGFRGPICPGGAIANALAAGGPARTQAEMALPEPLAGAFGDRGIRVGLATPVLVAGAVWGALVVVAADPAALPEGAEDALLPFARLAGLAIGNAEDRRRLAERASTDPLTGLPNHGVFHERLHDETAVAIRQGARLSLAVIDLDHFKEINDTHGHQTGDRVLAEVAARLRATARDGEVVARVGGEEFAWIMPGTAIEDAVRAAERVRAAIAAAPVEGLQLSASVGVCELDDAGTAGELFRLADAALLLAKAHGRDMTVRFEPGVLDETDGDERLRRAERARTLAALRALARAVDARDAATQRHSERVADLTFRIAVELGWTDDRARALREAALVHDVGKIGIPDDVLRKPSGLSDAEFAQVAAHPELGAVIVAEVLSPEQVGWVRHHHERIDGRGYPAGLAGDRIPEGARVLAAADAWDAMTTDRPYRRALTPADAMAECQRVAGQQLDPAAVAAMERLAAAGDLDVADGDRPGWTVPLAA